jgi:hypothetical protein
MLSRKTPLKPGKGFTAKPGSSLKRSGFVSSRPAPAAVDRPSKLPPRREIPAAEKIPKLPKAVRTSRPEPNAQEKAHMGRVASMGCILCSHVFGIHGTPAIVHHLRTDQGKKRASHFDTLPLCPPHHQHSGVGVHDMGRRQFEAKYGISEVGLLHIVQAALGIPLYVSPYTRT